MTMQIPGEMEHAYVRRSELALVVIGESMTRAAMHKRVEVEAERRGIERVAWIEEF
jgi:diphthamide biosynthesis methyltransferase